MTQKFNQCILHIGTEKTGTSSIQYFLDSNRKGLAENGIFYPVTKSKKAGSQWEFVAVAARSPWENDLGRICKIGDANSQKRFTNDLTEDLNNQFLKSKSCSTLLISSEHFHSRLTTVDDIILLRDFLTQWANTFKVIVYFRRQDKLAVSHFTTLVKNGYDTDTLVIPDYATSMNFYRYDQVYNNWADVFGKGNIVAEIYDQKFSVSNTLIENFGNKIGLSNTSGFVQTQSVNRSINRQGLYVIKRIHELYASDRKILNLAKRDEFIDHISQTHPGKFYPLDKVGAKEFYNRFTEHNKVLANAAFDGRANIFSSNFDEYPETVDKFIENDAYIVELLLKFWEKSREPKKLRRLSLVQSIFKKTSHE